MPRKSPARLPITPATVTVDGYYRNPLNYIWSHLLWNDARVYADNSGSCLLVPECHPDDNLEGQHCDWPTIRPRDKYADYRFAKQRNGNWMLVRETADV